MIPTNIPLLGQLTSPLPKDVEFLSLHYKLLQK